VIERHPAWISSPTEPGPRYRRYREVSTASASRTAPVDKEPPSRSPRVDTDRPSVEAEASVSSRSLAVTVATSKTTQCPVDEPPEIYWAHS
jgi:hypothetical protein